MRVSDDRGAENAVEERVGARDGGRTDERDQGGAQQALERPVVLSVSLVRGRERGRVVDGAFDVCRSGGARWVSETRRARRLRRSVDTHRLR